MRIVVSGVKGSGKTTTINYVKKKIDVKVLSFGDYVVKLAEKKYGSVEREVMEEKSREEHVEIQKMAAKQMKKDMESLKNIIIDTNLFFLKKDGIFPGLPEYVLEILNPDVLVILENDPKDILSRRLRDETKAGIHSIGVGKTRKRHAGRTIKKIEEELELQKKFAVSCSNYTGCTIKIINLKYKESKPFEHAEKAAEEIVKILQG